MMITKITHHRAGMSPTAVRVLEAAVAYAEEHSERRQLTMSFREFYKLTGLPTTTERAELVSLVSKVRRTISSLRTIDDDGPTKKELLIGSWPVFEEIFITNTRISFRVSPNMWENVKRRFEAEWVR
ncbi:RepB family plasmid replication initiator protein [Massilia sp. WF1]|uniref:RepB family plasmid replication initiator protein n=1 Tax=unclassified Massilia TaxID=2609279 RepID=UPI0035A2647B